MPGYRLFHSLLPVVLKQAVFIFLILYIPGMEFLDMFNQRTVPVAKILLPFIMARFAV